jgi:UDP-glucose 4-epimerase
MKVVILGGAGFIGSHLVDELTAADHEVRVFDVPNMNRTYLRRHENRIDIVGGDFLNATDISRATAGMDAVIHLVCTTLPGPSNENPVYDVTSNVVGTIRLLETALKNGVKKIIFASSGGTVYGIPEILPIPETHPTNPLCSYGITKLAVEKYLSLFDHLHGLRSVVLRLANPYGERQRTDGVQGAVAVFLGKLKSKTAITIWGDGSVARDYFYIRDLTDAFRRAVEISPPRPAYNIGSGVAVTLRELLSVIGEVTGKTPDVRFQPGRKLDVPVNAIDITSARRDLGWRPRTSLRQGIARTWEWLNRECDRS